MKKYFILYALLIFVTTMVTSFYPLLTLDSSQILYLYSASAQVVGGLFGLTLAGYIFYRNQNDKEIRVNYELEKVVTEMARNTHRWILIIAFLGFASVGGSFLNMSTINKSLPVIVHNLLLNFTMIIIISELVVIFSFALTVTDPKSRERFCQRQIDSFSKKETGPVEMYIETLELYGRIISHLTKLELELIKSKGIRKTKTFSEGVSTLCMYGKVDPRYARKLNLIHDYIIYQKYAKERKGHPIVLDFTKKLVSDLNIPIIDLKSIFEEETGLKRTQN